MEHTPVLLSEIVEIFRHINELGSSLRESVFVDATVGGGGHAAAILAAKSKVKSQKSKIQFKSQNYSKIKLIGIDTDQNALEIATENLKQLSDHVTLVHGNFRDIKAILNELKIEKVAGILADLGMSSLQLSDPERGFSFRDEAPLDMRMDNNSKFKSQNSKLQFKIQNYPRTKNQELKTGQLSAELIIKTWNEAKIADILWQYGEERFARKIARAIRENRKDINTTKDLAELCEKCVPPRFRNYKIHPATKTFQALRIAVNDEIEALKEFLQDAPELLAPDGRLAIISFHSLEDRLVKQRFNLLRTMNYGLLTKKPIIAQDDEVFSNPRSRSAKLRVIEKISRPMDHGKSRQFCS